MCIYIDDINICRIKLRKNKLFKCKNPFYNIIRIYEIPILLNSGAEKIVQ